MKKILTALRFALALLLAAPVMPAKAASLFWNPYIVTGAVSGTGGVCRLTISPAIVGGGLTSANTVTTTGITGATGCNVTAAISTVVDSTHIELTGTTFGGVYATGGCVAGGVWSSTNTANWAASSTATCGSGGSSVPASADTATLDANSLAGSVIPNYNFSVTNLTTGAYVGTLDFSINNPNPTLSGEWNNSGTGARTINCGTSAFTWSPGGAISLTNATTTNLTWNCGSANFALSGALASARSVQLGGLSYGPWTINTNSSRGGVVFTQAGTLASLSLAAGTQFYPETSTLTITGVGTWSGTSSNPITFVGVNGGIPGTGVSVSVGSAITCTWCAIGSVTLSGAGSLTATNSLNLGLTSGAGLSITPPSAGGGGGFIINGSIEPGDIFPDNENLAISKVASR